MMTTTPPADPASVSTVQSFRQWRHGDSLESALTRAEAAVRKQPANFQARWLLFELLCVTGAWERSLKQLQICVSLQPSMQATAQAMRGLIQSEQQRLDVFAGRQQPVPVVDMSDWMVGLVEAIRLNASGDHAAADEARAAALAKAPEAVGQGNLGAFEWITDSDTRLGPVCELVAAGSYRWVSFGDLRSIRLSAPKTLLDHIWAAAQVELQGGVTLRAYLPARYPEKAMDSGTAGSTRMDALQLARETVWREVGSTGVFGHGQKTWMTDAGDWPLLDVRECEFVPSTAPEKEVRA